MTEPTEKSAEERWRITPMRIAANILIHDLGMSLEDVVPILNRIWTEAVDLAIQRAREEERESASCRLCRCCLDAPDRHGEILSEWIERAESAWQERARTARLRK